MGLFSFFSKKKKHKFKVGDVVKVTPNPNIFVGASRGDPKILEQANGIGKVGEIYDSPDRSTCYLVNLVIVGNNWVGTICAEEELEPYE